MAGYGVFIGVAEYDDDGFRSYPTIRNSAAELKRLFDSSGLWGECVEVVDPFDANELMGVLSPIADKCDVDDVLLVYFCGHGEIVAHSGRDAETHLVLRGSEWGKVWSQLALHHIYDELRRSSAKAKVLILDCCNCGEAPVLGSAIPDGSDEPDDESTWVLKALRYGEQFAKATRTGGDGEYTAFSGALIDVLSNGLPGSGELLEIEEVYRELCARMKRDRYPVPDVIRRGSARVPLMENGLPGDRRALELLGGLAVGDLVEMWARREPGEGVPRPLLKQHLRARLSDVGNAQDFVHHSHAPWVRADQAQREIVSVVLSALEDRSAQAARLLAQSGCPDCAAFARKLLGAAVDELAADGLVPFHNELAEQGAAELESEFVRLVPVEKFRAVTAHLQAQHGSRVHGGSVDRLFGLFATVREHRQVRDLIELLRLDGDEFAAGTVLEHVALGLPAADVARFVRLVVQHDALWVCDLVARRRLPRDVAEFVAAFGPAESDVVMRMLLPIAVKNSSADQLIRLTRALAGCGLADAPSAVLQAALGSERLTANVGELLCALTEGDLDQRSRIDSVLRSYLIRCATQQEVQRWLRRDASVLIEGLLHDVIAARGINDAIEFHRFLLGSGDAQWAAEVARAVAGSHKAVDLMRFVQRAGAGPESISEFFRQVGRRRDGETIGHMVLWWENPKNWPEGYPEGVVLVDLFASAVSPAVLLQARHHWGEIGNQGPLGQLIRKALERPQRFAASDVAALLEDLCRDGRPAELIRMLIGRLDDHFSNSGGGPVDVEYLAEFVVAVDRGAVPPQFRRVILDDVADVVQTRYDPELDAGYEAALRRGGAQRLADDYGEMVNP